MRLYAEGKPLSKPAEISGLSATFKECEGIWKGVILEPEEWQFDIVGPVYSFDKPVVVADNFQV